MCGICGFYGFRDKNLLKGMLKVIEHRGPDDEGLYEDNVASLGNRRLSIIDLKKGSQPIYNEDKSLVIVYNGEVYNFRELRKRLEKRHRFHTNSDTEAILHAYEEYGPECVKYFNGMFAFAIYNKKDKTLFLARDRLGIKPIYYYLEEGKFLFASEIKSILKDKSIKRELNKEALIDYLAFQNVIDEKTFFEGINILLPGHYILMKGKDIQIEQYWEADYKKEELGNIGKYLEKFNKIFSESIERHMISDVPLGTSLSGGFDSSSVATITSKFHKNNLKTFTGKFKEGDKHEKYDITNYSKAVAEKINAEPYEVLVTPLDFKKNIKKIIYHLEEPRADVTSISRYMLYKLVSENVKVVLTGEGGDELFAGYPVYKATYFKDLIKENPLNLFKALNLFKPTEVPRILYFLFFPFFDKEVKDGLFILFNDKERKKLLTRDFHKKIEGHSPVKTIEKYIKNKNLSDSDKAQYLYLKTYLPFSFIMNDKLGMAHSIEARIPFCDNELVEFSNSIPLKYKLYNNQLKYIIKKSMEKELPPIIYKQPKRGFSTPFPMWIRKELKDFIYGILLGEKTRKRGIFNIDYIKKMLDKHCSSNQDLLWDLVVAAKVWSLLSIELWFRVFIDDVQTL